MGGGRLFASRGRGSVRWDCRAIPYFSLGIGKLYLEYLVFQAGVSEGFAQAVDDTGAYLCLAAGVLFSLRLLSNLETTRANRTRWMAIFRWLELIAAGFVAVWFVADALAHTERGGIFSELTIGEVAVRFACPLALILLTQPNVRQTNKASLTARWILTLAISTTFIVHGFKSLQLYGPFCDLILLTDLRLFQLELSQSTAETALVIIGWIDILIAVAMLVTRYKPIATYMIFWGLITSASRMTAFGWTAWPETLVRAANWGAVLAVLLLWQWESAQTDNRETPIQKFISRQYSR